MIDVRFIRQRYYEHAVHDGDVDYHETRIEDATADDVGEAIRWIRDMGLTFTATGNDWAASPDGSTVIDFATGEMEDVTAHVYNLHPWEWAALVAGVDCNQGVATVNPGVPDDWSGK